MVVKMTLLAANITNILQAGFATIFLQQKFENKISKQRKAP